MKNEPHVSVSHKGSAQTCWLCLRVGGLNEILKAANRLFQDKETAHRVGTKAAKILRKAYMENPMAVCGKSTAGLIGAALYTTCLLEMEQPKSQLEIVEALESKTTMVTIGKIYGNLIDRKKVYEIITRWEKQIVSDYVSYLKREIVPLLDVLQSAEEPLTFKEIKCKRGSKYKLGTVLKRCLHLGIVKEVTGYKRPTWKKYCLAERSFDEGLYCRASLRPKKRRSWY